MRTRKSLLLSGGILAIAALLGATNASSATPPTSCTTADYRIDVNIQTSGGRTSFEYSLSDAPGRHHHERANRFFAFLPPRLLPGPEGTIAGLPSGSFLLNGSFAPKHCPPKTAWIYDKTDDGYCFKLSAIGDKPKLSVTGSEVRTTTVLVGKSEGEGEGDFQSCAIAGPGPLLPGSPLATHTENQTMANGCRYIMTIDTNNFVTGAVVDPAGPLHATVSPFEACAVEVADNICVRDHPNLTFCPPIQGGEQPIQGSLGGTCYYPSNIKVTC